ncbi:hypothetical protein AVDCRST_MAG81-26, partial [uncultured Synechococcales cyanobacterium]
GTSSCRGWYERLEFKSIERITHSRGKAFRLGELSLTLLLL